MISNLYCNEKIGLDNLFLQGSIRLLVLWSLPCFILKTVREVVRILYVHHESWWLSTAICLALIVSWTYLSTISLSASILFHLVCNLQVMHFEDYAKLMEHESDVLVLIEEHMRLRYYLSKISHRFRIYLLLEFLFVTASLFVTLFQTTAYSGIITFINGGDFAVSSVVQVVGIIICLHAATKISHRAQNIASLASRWHAVATCSSTDASQLRASSSGGSLEASGALNSLHMNYSESDLESLDYLSMPTSAQLASYMSSYHRRQAFAQGRDTYDPWASGARPGRMFKCSITYCICRQTPGALPFLDGQLIGLLSQQSSSLNSLLLHLYSERPSFLVLVNLPVKAALNTSHLQEINANAAASFDAVMATFPGSLGLEFLV
ncbi:hypothetical protein Pint_23674 [Pistacia integerrima]|uniref:Uncharacterized protein n=1 Tax=Pistacia integerrima TaxID=434235 RepID=A0ACC0YJA1_9ROSI|nr:hypothetical protein Pint_23674 [Pistacia integerrima]